MPKEHRMPHREADLQLPLEGCGKVCHEGEVEERWESVGFTR